MHPVRSSLRAAVLLAAGVLGASALRADPAALPATLDLKTAIRYALEGNFAIRQARERIKQQEGVVIEVTAREIPNIAASGSYQHNDLEITQTSPASDRYWAISLTATQTLFAGGGVRSSVKSSELAREAALLDLKSVINDALLSVRTAYYGVLLTREKINVQEKNLELLQQQLKNVTNRFDAGTVSSFEKLRAEVAVANAKVPLITARNDYRLAVESLRQALGFATSRPEDFVRIPDFTGTLDFTPATFELKSSSEAAQANRPDLQRLSKLADARGEAVTAAKSSYYPTVQAFGGWQLRKGFSNEFRDSRDGWLVGVQSNWAIFDGRATAGRVAQARSVQEQSKLALTEAQLNVEIEVRRAYSSWQQATELADASRKVVEQAEEAVRLATARYDAGTATQLDVLQAQVDLTTARTNQLQAYYSYNIATATLRKAMGQADEFVEN
ncbi:MAG TPA: TolC family protein [Opitutaceae bacterium]|nr:TolC family protein [Opitutaceae bacterium]HND61647.1 TolC family protein [Opitutaceae bacterium]